MSNLPRPSTFDVKKIKQAFANLISDKDYTTGKISKPLCTSIVAYWIRKWFAFKIWLDSLVDRETVFQTRGTVFKIRSCQYKIDYVILSWNLNWSYFVHLIISLTKHNRLRTLNNAASNAIILLGSSKMSNV